MPDLADVKPSVDEVAAIVRARTKDDVSNEVGTFNDDTRPTGGQVESLIGLAAGDVAMRTGSSFPDDLAEAATNAIALKAAQLVELSYFPEQADDRLMAYQSLRLSYEEAVARLVQAVEVRGLFAETEPDPAP